MSGVTEREYRGCSERACASGSRATDGRDVGVDRAPLELVQRQRQQQVDPPAEQQERIPERRPLPGLVALHLSGIRHAPVGDQWLSWKDRARLLRSIAHGDHVVPGLALQAIERARRMAGPGMPCARSVSIAWGFTCAAGWEPALSAWNRPFPFQLSRASAIWLRAEFPVHRNSTRKRRGPFTRACGRG